MTWVARITVVLAALLLGVGGLTTLPPLVSQAGAYLADRNVGLALLLLILLLVGWNRALGAVLLATAAMHLVDAAADIRFGNVPATIGSVLVGVVSAGVALWLLRQAPTPVSAGRAEP